MVFSVQCFSSFAMNTQQELSDMENEKNKCNYDHRQWLRVKTVEEINSSYMPPNQPNPPRNNDVESFVQYFPIFVDNKLFSYGAMHCAYKKKELLQPKDPGCQSAGTSTNTAATVRKVYKPKFGKKNKEMRVVSDNSSTSKERFKPEIWIANNVVLQIQDTDSEKQRNLISGSQSTIIVTSDPIIKQRMSKIVTTYLPSPLRIHTSNNDQPVMKKTMIPFLEE